jgi:hypothetical protein
MLVSSPARKKNIHAAAIPATHWAMAFMVFERDGLAPEAVN